MAVEGQKFKNARLLLEAGASPHDAGEDTDTPLEKAINSGNQPLLKLLKQFDAK